MKIWMSPYALVPRGSKPSVRGGSLLRVETKEWSGFADLHPWPELGDEPLDRQIESLRAGKPLRLAARSLAWSELDGRARGAKVSAFQGLEIPSSHFLVTDGSVAGYELIGAIEHDGFRAAKIKVGRDPERELEVLSRLSEDSESRVRLRLDFNASMDAGSVRAFVSALPAVVRARIEFIEDPCPFDDKVWTELSAELPPLALDRDSFRPEAVEQAAKGAAKVLVIKPVIDDAQEVFANFIAVAPPESYAVVTTYLDHPLGQISAAFAAAALAKSFPTRLGDCGLVSHRIYEPNQFSEVLRTQGPRLFAPEGTGLGFDDILAKQEWTELR